MPLSPDSEGHLTGGTDGGTGPSSPRLFHRPSLATEPARAAERLSSAARNGRILRLERDVYIARRAWEEAPAWGRYGLAVAAKAHSVPYALFCRESALLLWRVPLLTVPRSITVRTRGRGHVGSRPARRLGTVGSGLRGFGLRRVKVPQNAPDMRTLPPAALSVVRGPETGYRVELLEDVLIDTLPHLSKYASAVALDAVVAGARRGGARSNEAWRSSVDRRLLVERAEGLEVKRHRRRAVEAIESAEPMSESPGESVTRMLLADLGFPAFTLQSRIEAGGSVYWADFECEQVGLVVEFDGLTKYRGTWSADGISGEAAAEAVIQEKLREDAIRSTGRKVLRLTWDDLKNPYRLEGQMRRAGVPQDLRRRREPGPW